MAGDDMEMEEEKYEEEGKGDMTVKEAGRKGGQKVKKLIEEGEEMEREKEMEEEEEE